ncbi:MAG: Rpn family recombination-promoting nuclease/putative transposase, partial [Tannerellaceae bacterium]|nr:Rpn family recombination-promoting nuclease/putative transposase [Tannerellaceae bacterium]
KTRFSDKLNFFFIELPKFNKPLDEVKTNSDRWFYTLKHLSDLEKRPPEIQGAIFERLFELAKIDKLTPNEMKTYKESLLEYSDVRAIADYARDEGIAEGEWRNTVRVVMNSHRTGLSLDSIAIVTGLSIEEVKSIISSQLS